MSLLLQKTGFYALNSEWKKVPAGSHSSLAHAFLLLAAFWCHLVHFLGEKSILPYFSSLSMVAILDCDSHSQAGSTRMWVDRSQSLFYFVPQEKRLIWRPCWGWKNMGESFFHRKNGPTGMKKPAKSRKACTKLPWELAETSFRSLFKPLKSFFWGFCLNCTKSPQQGFLQGCIFIFLTTAFPDLLVGISQLQRRFSWTKQLPFKQNYS